MKRNDTSLDVYETGQNLKKIMIEKDLTAKDIQTYLNLGTVQSVYHWFEGKCLPSVDNLYALSELFRVPVDVMLRGNRKCDFDPDIDLRTTTRLFIYYKMLTRRNNG